MLLSACPTFGSKLIGNWPYAVICLNLAFWEGGLPRTFCPGAGLWAKSGMETRARNGRTRTRRMYPPGFTVSFPWRVRDLPYGQGGYARVMRRSSCKMERNGTKRNKTGRFFDGELRSTTRFMRILGRPLLRNVGYVS